MQLRKIVDSNYLQSPQLEEYLARSANHHAVLTDYAAMEAYKGDTLASIYRSMELLAKYPSQVIVLKNTLLVCGLKGRSSNLQRRMIDADQTAGFTQYCRHLKSAANGDKAVQDQLLDMGREADEQMQRMLHDADKIAEALQGIGNLFSVAELKILRRKERYPSDMLDKIMKNAMILAAIFFRDHPRVSKVPNAQQLASTYIFRFSLCAMMLALKKLETGAENNLNPKILRNDMVDLSFATYGTFFDGLLTADRNLKELFLTAKVVLNLGFGV
jgi:hypothetical protein